MPSISVAIDVGGPARCLVSLNSDLCDARAAFAAAVCPTLPGVALGEISLQPHQLHSVARAVGALKRDGGCLIAEDVGQGKTFIALAIAAAWQRPLLVIPASLYHAWRRAMLRAGVHCDVITHHALSRGVTPAREPDGIIVDESHHFRNPQARRHAALAEVSAFAPVVLLSATPLQNRSRDLAAQLALYLGEQAYSLGSEDLARFVIRGSGASDLTLPRVQPPEWLPLQVDDSAVLRAILALPTPARPTDAGDASALRTLSLVRAWASSRAALVAMLRRRACTAAAIEQSAEAGKTVTRAETRSWRGAHDVIQLGLTALLVDAEASDGDVRTIRRQLVRDQRAAQQLSLAIRSTPDPDESRVRAIRAVRLRHPCARILAFSEFASTVGALYQALRADAGVGMLTATTARIASGTLSRVQLLERFAPHAQEALRTPAHEQVTLLLTTDLLSEGLDLQDAAVVIHLDLPWNPARLSQRMGRIRRPGGSSTVCSYLLSPPAAAAALLRAESRLRRKIEHAHGTVGGAFAVLPMPPPLASSSSAALVHASMSRAPVETSAAALGTMIERVATWRATGAIPSEVFTPPRIAAVRAPLHGWLAAFADGRWTAAIRGKPVGSAFALARLLPHAEGVSLKVNADACNAARREVDSWLAAEELIRLCGVCALPGPLRLQIVSAVRTHLNRIPRHRRAAALSLARRLHDALGDPLPLGAERMIAAKLANPAHPHTVVDVLGGAADLADRARVGRCHADATQSTALVALILFHE